MNGTAANLIFASFTALFRINHMPEDWFYCTRSLLIQLYLQAANFRKAKKIISMQASFSGKTSSQGSDYDFLNTVFEWVFYNLPPRADNTFARNMYEFYKTRGGLSKKQLEALLRIINGIGVTPPFSTATLEAIIKKKATKSKNALPPASPLYKEDTDSKEKLAQIFAIAPAHKGALMYMNKLSNNEPLTQADKDAINKFHLLLTSARKK